MRDTGVRGSQRDSSRRQRQPRRQLAGECRFGAVV